MTSSSIPPAGKNAENSPFQNYTDDKTPASAGLDLIDYASIPPGKVSVSNKPFSPKDLTEKVALKIAQHNRSNPVRLHCYIPIKTPDQLEGDSFIIEQVLLRLTDNALKHTIEGEIYISCEVTDIYEEGELAMIRFEVRDTGTGVKSDQQEQLIKPFETYFDDEQSYAPKQQGLGLSIVERLVQLMGGHVHIESAYGLGSRFWFELPLGLKNISTSIPDAEFNNHLEGRYVLIIARNESSQFILKNYIKDWKARPIIATDKTEAVLMLRNSLALNEPFYAILIDQDEPAINQDLIEAIRDKRRHDSVPVIVINSHQHTYKHITAAISSPITSTKLYRLLNHDIRQLQAHTHQIPATKSPECKILLVEKNRLDATIATTILENLDVQIDHINDESQLIQKIIDNNYQLLLISIPTAEKGLYDTHIVNVIRTWENHTGQTHLPIISIAPYIPGIKPVEYLKQFGINDYISKPIRKDEMLKVVGNCLPHAIIDDSTVAVPA